MKLSLFISFLQSMYWYRMPNSMADMACKQENKILQVPLTMYSDNLLAALEIANPGKKIAVDSSVYSNQLLSYLARFDG